LFDAFNDRSYPERWIDAEPDCIAIVDGAFLLRPELENCWDVLVWLDIDFETMVERARERDMAWVGSEDAVVERYRDTGSPRTDERLANPRARAHVLIDNRLPHAPILRRLNCPQL
jgi:uridine kinase